MKKRTYSIGKAAIIRCLSVAAILTVAVFSGCTPDSPENPENPREELDEGNIKINVSGGGELGDYTTKAAASREARYTVTGRVISGNGAGIEDETFEVVVTPNEGPTGFMPATRASYGAVQTDGTKKTATIRWDEGDRVSVFSDVGKHDNTYAHPGTGNVNNIAYCNYDIKEEQTAEGYTATATPVAAAPFNGSGLKWDTGKAHRFIGIWPPVDTIATLADAKIEADRLELSFNVKQPSEQTAKLDANISNESVYRPDLGSVMMYSGLSVAADKAVESTDVDLLFRPAFTSLEFALLKQQDDTKTMTLQYVTVSSQEDILACESGQKFTGVISQDANASGNNGTTFTIDATSLESTGSKSIDLTFLDASGADLTPELDFTKPTKFCILALPHQIGMLTIFLGLKVGGEDVVRQLDLRVNENGVKKWIEIPACSKVIISNLRIPTSVTKGLVQKAFTVAPNKTVYFSPGNLQAKLNGQGGAAQWRFAPNQYDIIAETGSNTNVANGDGWVDLFGWSGSDNLRNTKWGLRTSNSISRYGGYYENWGTNQDVINALGANWKLLTKYEIEYLLGNVLSPAPEDYRPNADQKASLATVGNVKGIVILPDEWTLPTNCTFTPMASDYTTNTYSTAGAPGKNGSWTAMERAGAVFFPNTGVVASNGTYTPAQTYYQTSSLISEEIDPDEFYLTAQRYHTWGYSDNIVTQDESMASGLPVRLSRTTANGSPIDYTGPGVTTHEFSIGEGVKVQFTTSNLMWDGTLKRFRLMDDAWSTIEAEGKVLGANRIVSEDIGLFKWGTGGGNNIWPWTTRTDLVNFGMDNSVTNYTTWDYDRYFGRYWDWGDNEVYDAVGTQMCAEKENTRLRTLSSDEWNYLLHKRSDPLRWIFAKVNEIPGIVLFPDAYNHPTTVTSVQTRHYNVDPSTGGSIWLSSRKFATITAEDFDKMATNGAVFLPAAGFSNPAQDNGKVVLNGEVCYYWTNTIPEKNALRPEEAYFFTTGHDWYDGYRPANPKNYQYSVRLVYDKAFNGRALLPPVPSWE